MRHKTLIAIFATLLLIVVAILASMLNTQKIEDLSNSPIMQNVIKVAQKASNPKHWTTKMADIKTAQHHLPVNELYVQIDLDRFEKQKSGPTSARKAKNEPIESFRLVVNRADRYSLYCIKQTLSFFPDSYSVVREKGKTSVLVSSESEKNLKEMVRRLKEHDIKSTIEKVWL